MADWKGHFDDKGSPILKIAVEVPSAELAEYESIIDTGFTGFLSLPLSLLSIFKDQIEGLQFVTFAEGTSAFLLKFMATIVIDGERISGTAIIEPGGNEVIVGMKFLKASKRGLVLFSGKDEVLLPKDL